MMRTLEQLHGHGVIHRDVHPDNVYLVYEIGESDRTSGAAPQGPASPWRFFDYGRSWHQYLTRSARSAEDRQTFRLAWVLVDCSFATLADSSASVPFKHGSFTPPEQVEDRAIVASDMYALGATLYFGITGHDLPSYRERGRTGAPGNFPTGSHSSHEFPHHLSRLVALNAIERPIASKRLEENTVKPGYTGTLLIGENLLLLCDVFSSETVIASRDRALTLYRKLLQEIDLRWDAAIAERLHTMIKFLE
ncbi:MAG TPA: hypothetical protein VIA62_26840 [Thermoanaerobaculia bacterium]|jgi:serine/threonine protein kinase|nr:hypothetical protein [Thermoanaerobaculia bacterium]